MKKKICLMKNVAHNFETVVMADENGDASYYEDMEYVRMSEIIEIDFPELDNKVIISKQVAIIEKQITKVRADAEAAVTALDGRKQELLAICHIEDGQVKADNQ